MNLTTFLLLLLVAVGISALFGGSDEGGSSDPSDLEIVMACQRFVEQRLVSPGTAEFERASQVRISSQPGNRWIARSYVDSQNRMGATIRSNWTCDIRSDGGQWHLNDLQITER